MMHFNQRCLPNTALKTTNQPSKMVQRTDIGVSQHNFQHEVYEVLTGNFLGAVKHTFAETSIVPAIFKFKFSQLG